MSERPGGPPLLLTTVPPQLAELVERAAGLSMLRGGTHGAVLRFVNERLAALAIRRLDDYMTLVSDVAGSELRRLLESITVPHTWFYRDSEQLQIVSRLLSNAPPGRLNVWVAGCATGEEAYTLAMIGRRINRDIHVLATDINDIALAHARRGEYTALAIREVPELERRWLPQRDNLYVVDNVLRNAVTFVRHNLVEPPPKAPSHGWDLVVCRNVMIYFSPPAVERLLERFARSLREGGLLVVGAAEVMFEPPAGLESISLVSSSSAHRVVLRRPIRGQATMTTQRLPPPKPTLFPPRTDKPTTDRGPFGTIKAEPKPTTDRSLTKPSEAKPIEPRTITERNAAIAPPRSPPPPSTPPPPPPPPPTTSTDELLAQLLRGHQLFERHDIAGAIQAYQDLTVRYPVGAEAWLFLGIAHYSHSELTAAAVALRATLCLDPGLWAANFYLARACERLGLRAEALQQYDLIANTDDLKPLPLRSGHNSVVVAELLAYRHDLKNVARRVTSDRGVTLRRPDKDRTDKDKLDPDKDP